MALLIVLLLAAIALGHAIPALDVPHALAVSTLGQIDGDLTLTTSLAQLNNNRRYRHRRYSNVFKREVTDKDWSTYVKKGQSFSCLMKADVDGATKMMQKSGRPGSESITSSQSPWEYSDLENLKTDYQTDFSSGGSQPIKTALDALDLSTVSAENGGPNEGMLWEATSARYQEIYNVKQGTIIAWGNYGAEYQLRHEDGSEYKGNDKPLPPIVPLKQFSDVVYLEWQHILQSSNPPPNKVQDLRYIFKLFISTDVTNGLIKRALLNKQQQLSPWPGYSFFPESDEFRALLGSPNGGGIGWLLINHKVQLGLKAVSKITIFRYEGGGDDSDPMMLFEIKDFNADTESESGDAGDDD